MKEIIEIKNLNNDIFVHWVITNFCNQDCTYCPPALKQGKFAKSQGFPTDHDIDKFIDTLIDTQRTTQKRLMINISGGEPTAHPKCGNIIERLHDYAVIILTTNGTRGISWWKSLPHLPNLVILSLHPEYYDSKKIRINELCEFLNDNGVSIRFNLMCHPQMWDTVLKIVDDVDDRFKPFIVPKILQHQSTVSRNLHQYTEEQLNFVKNYPTKLNMNFTWDCESVYSDNTTRRTLPNTIMAEGQHYFQNWRCSAGSEGIDVYANGQVSAGICKVKILGHISNFKFLDEYLTCSRPNCTFPGDIQLNKYNPAIVKK